MFRSDGSFSSCLSKENLEKNKLAYKLKILLVLEYEKKIRRIRVLSGRWDEMERNFYTLEKNELQFFLFSKHYNAIYLKYVMVYRRILKF